LDQTDPTEKSIMKKIIALSLTVFLLLSMTSCAGISSFSDFFENTVPNVIVNQIKNDIVSSDSESVSTTTPQNNASTPQNNSSTQKNDSVLSSSPSTDSGIDCAELINTITTDTLKACVNIRTSESNTNTSQTPERSSIGSGVIFKAEKELDTYHYYVLTNYHVIELSGNYRYYNHTIKDCQGNSYQAINTSWLKNDNITNLCKENDLAVIEFETTTELKAIEIETKNPDTEETVISIGQPKGQQNAITFGIVEGYTEVSVQNTFTPSFDVIAHNAPIDHGNSGGAILNTDLKLVGINFAGSWNDDGSFAFGYGIPIETVKEFISDFEISL
jgi:serine protease Do